MIKKIFLALSVGFAIITFIAIAISLFSSEVNSTAIVVIPFLLQLMSTAVYRKLK